MQASAPSLFQLVFKLILRVFQGTPSFSERPAPLSEKPLKTTTVVGTLCVSLLSASCTGSLGPGLGDNDEAGGPAKPNSPDGYQETKDGKLLPISAGATGIRRLRRLELEHSVRDLLPALPGDFDVSRDIPKDNHVELAFAVPGTVSELEVNRFSDLAEEVLLELGTQSPGAMFSCSDPEAVCAERFVSTLAEKAFRRAPLAEEVADLMSLYESLRSDPEVSFSVPEALDVVVEALLQSPGFLYRWELGPQAPALDGAALDGAAALNGAALVKFTPSEMASRLSYFLWRSPPDEILREAAKAGLLATTEDVAAQTRRMLSDPRFDAALRDFVVQWLEISELPTIVKDSGVYPTFNLSLAQAMYDEAGSFMTEVFRSSTPTLDAVLTETATTVTPELAQYYGVALSADGKADLSTTARKGILMQGAVLSAKGNSYRTSPVRRGKFILNRLLCEEVPPPPPDAVVDLPPAQPGLTLREQLAQHASSKACSNCHSTMDPLGLAFEHFDGAGAYRELEDSRPIDASGQLSIAGVDWEFDDAGELVDLLVDEPLVHECFALQWMRYALDRFEQSVEAGAAARIIEAHETAHLNITELVVAITTSKPFSHRTLSEGEVPLP